MSKIKGLVEDSKIVLNVIGILIVLGLGIAVGILLDRGIVY